MQVDKNTSDASEPQPDVSSSHSPSFKERLTSRKGMVLIALALVLIIASVVFALTRDTDKKTATNTTKNQNQSATKQTEQSLFMQQYGQNCKERNVSFSSMPMKANELSFVRPLGAMSDGHVTPTDHVYIGGPNQNAADNTYPVLMPADGTITSIAAMPAQYIGDREGQKTASEDHRIVISHSCRYFSIYIHINKLSDKVRSVVGSLEPNENKQVDIELKAGDIVGYIGKSTFDWTPIDTTKKLKGFITPKLYDGESWKIHTVSPFDLYTGKLKSDFEAKSLRTTPPLGGKIDYDQPGKLVGNWFREGSGGYTGPAGNNGGRYWDGHLSVVPDYISPTSTIISTGNWNGSAKQMAVKGSVDTAAITKESGVVKYELLRLNYVSPTGGPTGNMYTKDMAPSQTESLQGTILLQVLPGEKLKVETFPGKSASQVSGFTATAQTYER